MGSKKEYLNISKAKKWQHMISEAMKMILSSESPDTEDLEDQG